MWPVRPSTPPRRWGWACSRRRSRRRWSHAARSPRTCAPRPRSSRARTPRSRARRGTAAVERVAVDEVGDRHRHRLACGRAGRRPASGIWVLSLRNSVMEARLRRPCSIGSSCAARRRGGADPGRHRPPRRRRLRRRRQLAAWIDAGVEVSYCIVTDGDAGGFDPEVAARTRSPASAAPSRPRPPRRSASPTCGSSATPTAALEASLELRRDISRVIRAGAAAAGGAPSRPSAATTASTPATPTTSPRARPRSARSTPTPATRSPTELLGRGPRGVDGRRGVAHGRPDPDVFVDITDTSTARWTPCSAT